MSSVLDQITKYLESLGISQTGAAGAAGNLYIESGFSPTAYNANEGAVGLAQWEGSRRTALDSYASAHGLSPNSLAAQLGYMGQEIRQRGLVSKLNAASTPQAAALVWAQDFEENAPSSDPARESAAAAIAAGKPPSTGGSSGSVTVPAGGTTAQNAASLSSLLPSMSSITNVIYKAAFGIAGAALVIVGLDLAAHPNGGMLPKVMPLPI